MSISVDTLNVNLFFVVTNIGYKLGLLSQNSQMRSQTKHIKSRNLTLSSEHTKPVHSFVSCPAKPVSDNQNGHFSSAWRFNEVLD